ncbi:dTDP-4-dehydrorhamnose reductase [Verticiella sediminum]|uniref:dTDP-4-dehydrorhamnose reductase n=1 Tax=Verticiella sediminum TaxID=1247510 RepID=A0A556B0F5_9BURK|nr:dTDP-4-dehydrorhamnose reductase [Verticiella sediminum]TSH98681.1 dTDP-4-dehydrorhamnose reductase [Verticiella sediminum]
MNVRILLLGSEGQVGWEAQRALGVLGDIVPITRQQCDLSDLYQVRVLVNKVAPDVIVNAAAYTAVDRAEADEAAATVLNADLPRVLAEESERGGRWLIHYSTDYVFDGASVGAYDESALTNPQSVYGRTKLAGERSARDTAKHLVFRTSWVFGSHGSNFLKTMLRLGRTRKSVRVVADQVGAPTSAALIADVTAHALKQALRNSNASGLYHLTSTGETSWHGYAQFIMAEAGRLGAKILCSPSNVEPIAAANYPAAATRPANSKLRTSQLQDTFSLALPGWEQQVTRTLKILLKD